MNLVLHNIRSTYNVGAIIRTAEGFGVSAVICSGYTPCVKKPGLLPHLAAKLDHQITKTAVGADKMVNLIWSDDIMETLKNLKNQDHLILGLENNLSDPRLVQLNSPKLPEILSGQDFTLVLGEEVHGIPEELYPIFDYFLEIPMVGQKESFNVSVAAGIVLFATSCYNK